jgi:serine/threonine-protein kinase
MDTPSDDATTATALDATLASPTTASHATLPTRYRLRGSLGAGGMGEVLLATDTQIDREVAIKRMLLEPSGPAVARFLREAKVQGRLDHPAIVPVYELSSDAEGRPFFVMKRLAGTTLADVLAHHTGDPRYTLQKLLRAFADVCLAVELAHSRNVVHRDLKPANIMLGDFGEVYVLDWGIARVLGETDPDPMASGASGELTQVGAILGTPGYIAPELVRGEPIDSRADVFGLGCILFEILTGQSLLRRGASAIASVLDDYEPRPSVRAPDRDIAPELDGACVAAIASTPTERPSARALAEMIEKFLDGDRDLAQRKRLASAHLEAARVAAAGDAEADRALAMREAGRALALDPTSGAADLLGRLMLEPPKEVPHEVIERLADLDDAARRTRASSFLPAYIACIVVLPLVIWMGLHGVWGIALYLGSTSLNVAACAWVIHRRGRATAFDMYLAVAANLLLVLVTPQLFGPVLIAPGIAIVIAMTFAADTQLRISKVIGLTIAVWLLPFVLEYLKLGPATFFSIDGDLRIHTEYFLVKLPQTTIAFVLYFVMVLLVSGLASRKLAINERVAIKTVELQAWHLRQLVRQA